MDKYFVFRSILDFLADEYEIVDADMNNYAGAIEITGKDGNGNTITVKVEMTEVKNNGN